MTASRIRVRKLIPVRGLMPCRCPYGTVEGSRVHKLIPIHGLMPCRSVKGSRHIAHLKTVGRSKAPETPPWALLSPFYRHHCHWSLAPPRTRAASMLPRSLRSTCTLASTPPTQCRPFVPSAIRLGSSALRPFGRMPTRMRRFL